MQNKAPKFTDDYFLDRKGNNKLRLKQFDLDYKYICKFKREVIFVMLNVLQDNFYPMLSGEMGGMEWKPMNMQKKLQ